MELLFFFLCFYLGQEFVEILFVPDGLFLRGFGFSQRHSGTDGEAKDGTHIRAGLFRFYTLAAFLGIFAGILNQPTKCLKTTQTSTERAAELTAV